MTHNIHLAFTSRDVPCTSVVKFDDDYPSLSCMFAYGSKSEPMTKASEIERRLRIHPAAVMIYLSQLEIQFSRKWRLLDINIAAHPRTWGRAVLKPIVGHIEDIFVNFDVDLDEDQRFQSEVPISVVWDNSEKQLAVRLEERPSVAVWRRLASGLFIATDSDGMFRELRFVELNLNPDEFR
jgi:hypothetical protein